MVNATYSGTNSNGSECCILCPNRGPTGLPIYVKEAQGRVEIFVIDQA